MSSALLVRFRPAGPWRLGPDNGARTQADTVLHSDSLYSAITLAMRDCGWLDEWIGATAESHSPAVRMSSGYPFSGSTLLIVPPKTVWPPPQGGKLRWKTARFVPLTLVPRLLAGEELSEDQWAVDPVSECLLPVFRNSVASAPFRVVQRVVAPVDRLTGATETVDRVACLQFGQGAGLWFIAEFADEDVRSVWAGRMRSAARLLADSGIGGGRSRGWGRSREPQFGNVDLPEFLTGIAASAEGETAWWTVSLFLPSEEDRVAWDRGTYSVVVRAGRTENGDLKPASRMVAEGSVLVSGSPPAGTARNVSPAELSHPVYRSGIVLAVPIPYQHRQRWELVEHGAVAAPGAETPSEEETAPLVEGEDLEGPQQGSLEEVAEWGREQLASRPEGPEENSGADTVLADTGAAEGEGAEEAAPPFRTESPAEAEILSDIRGEDAEPADGTERPTQAESFAPSAPPDEIPVGVDLPAPGWPPAPVWPTEEPERVIEDTATEGIGLAPSTLPSEQPELTEETTSFAVPPDEEAESAGIEPASEPPEDTATLKPDEEDER